MKYVNSKAFENGCIQSLISLVGLHSSETSKLALNLSNGEVWFIFDKTQFHKHKIFPKVRVRVDLKEATSIFDAVFRLDTFFEIDGEMIKAYNYGKYSKEVNLEEAVLILAENVNRSVLVGNSVFSDYKDGGMFVYHDKADNKIFNAIMKKTSE